MVIVDAESLLLQDIIQVEFFQRTAKEDPKPLQLETHLNGEVFAFL